MRIRPFVETNPAIDEYTPYAGNKRKGFGLYLLNGWCLFGVEYQPGGVYCASFALIVCNIAVGLWNDPD